MAGPKDSLNPFPISREQEQQDFFTQGDTLGRVVQQRLHVPYAALVHPQDLALIAASVYVGESAYFTAEEGMDTRAQRYAQSARPDILARIGISQEEFKQKYLELIGDEHFGNGIVADAIRNAAEHLSPLEMQMLEHEFGVFEGRLLHLLPDFLQANPGFSVDLETATLRGRATDLTQRVNPSGVMMEYGPGLAGIRRLGMGDGRFAQNLFVENTDFTTQALAAFAQLSGLEFPHVIFRNDGISSATRQILTDNGEGILDTIIASMVFHFAGVEETREGVVNGYKLLKPGGVLAIQAPTKVKPTQLSGIDIFYIARDTFGEPQSIEEFDYTNRILNEGISAYQAYFVK